MVLDPVDTPLRDRVPGVATGRVWKYDEAEPRDDAGRWASDGPVMGPGTADGNAAFGRGMAQLDRLRGQFPGVKIGFVDIQATGTGMFGGRDGDELIAAHVPSTVMSPEQRAAADALAARLGLPPDPGKPGDSILLNGRFWGKDATDPFADQHGKLAVPTPEGALTHEFGHAVDTYLSRATPDGPTAAERDQWASWRQAARDEYRGPDPSPLHDLSAYGRDRFKEAFGELFSLAYTPGVDTASLAPGVFGWVTSLRDAIGLTGIRKVALAWLAPLPTADLLALRAAALKYSEDEPRDDRGRWTSGDSIAGTVWGDRFARLAATGADAAQNNVAERFSQTFRGRYTDEQAGRMAMVGRDWNRDVQTDGGRALLAAAVKYFGASSNSWTSSIIGPRDPENIRDGRNLLQASQDLLRMNLGERAMTGTVDVYRGFQSGGSPFASGDQVQVGGNALSSWSTNRTEAATFGDTVFRMTIPVTDVAGISGTGLGNSQNQEVVVFGRPDQVATVVK